MIIITPSKNFSWFSTHPPLNLGKHFPGFGVEWSRNEDRTIFSNPLIKIPNGSFFPALSEQSMPPFIIRMVTTDLDLKKLDKVVDRINIACTEADGSARPILLSREYDPDWHRKARLTKISTEVGTSFNTVILEFQFVDRLWYGPVIEKVWDGPIDLSMKVDYKALSLNRAPSDFQLNVEGKVQMLTLVTSDINDDFIMYLRPQINGSIAIDTEKHIVKINGAEELSDLPPNFRLNKGLKIYGQGTANKITLKYRETKL